MGFFRDPNPKSKTLIELLPPNFPVLAADAGAGGAFVQLLPFILIFGIFYFLLILPQQRQRRKIQEMLANLKTGDRVLTSGGIYGTIVSFRDANVVQIQVANQVKLDLARSAVTAVEPAEGSASSRGETSQPEAGGKKK